jgi:pleckstrin homology domain containing family A member 8
LHGAICELDTIDSETSGHKPVGRRKTPDTLSLDLSKSNVIHVSEDSITPEFESPNEHFNAPQVESINDLPKEIEINEEIEIKEETTSTEKMFFNEIEHSFANISMIQRKNELELPINSFLSAAGDQKTINLF